MEAPDYQWYMPIYRDYPSPAPSDPSPAPRPHQPLEYGMSDAIDLQLDSSIGPTRVMRRKQPPRASFSASYAQSPLQLSPVVHPDRFPDRPSLYRPGTPSSMASPFSPYDYARRSRTRSTSHFDARAPSPSHSESSARTSPSSDPHRPESSRAGAAATGAIRTPHKEKHTKHRLRDIDRKNICLHHLHHPNARQEDIGHHFGVERSTISKILKDKEKWLNISSEDESNEQTAKHRPSKFPEVEEAMLKSLQNWSDTSTNITDQLIRQRALEIAKSFHISIDRFKGSSGWVENFKHRHDIRRGEWLRAERNPPQMHSFNLPAAHVHPQSHPPPTPVLVAYDQRMEAATSSEQHQLPPTHHWTPQTPQQAMVLDPALQTAVSAPVVPVPAPAPVSTHNLHNPHTAIQHSPDQVHYDYSQLYGPGIVPSTSQPTPLRPSLQEAEEALNTLIVFIDTDGQGILKADERTLLSHIKHALFQYGSGVPYERPTN
ncbi:hypothetical protein GALMADRAFT_275833 [Galerina marginata CBS 339.88]|uniref:HTH CENPB-type domain-containing protein n=1 Tax=Galerina marginata (strain CBS 339.88) TaxID=685588 RepID=A0A067TK61_GALM3|nr:hypothetical protein GALMADRAFT_275833 [Galerina marginata CBS 339.88]